MLKDDLEKCKEKHILTSFYSDRDDTDSFSVGYIQGISDKYVLTESISKYGNYDGFDLRLLNRIFSAEWGGLYEKKLEYLYGIKDKPKAAPKLEKDLCAALLKYAKETEAIVIVELFDSGLEDIQGFVEDFSREKVYIKCIDDFGREDGRTVFATENITGLSCDSEKCRTVKLLYMHNNTHN